MNNYDEFTNEDYDVPEFSSDEEEEEFVEAPGVTDLVDDEEYERKIEEEIFYKGFPEVEEIYNEGKNIEEIPVNYTRKQENLFKKGVQEIKKINAKYKCHLSFAEIVNSFDEAYLSYQKKMPRNSNMFNCMCYHLWRDACSFAVKMEDYQAYSRTSVKTIKSDLKQNFYEISKVLRLYVEMHPEKFPFDASSDIRPNDYVFDSKGNLRSTFKMDSISKFDREDYAYEFFERLDKISKIDFEKSPNVNVTKTFILKHVKSIIAGNGQKEITQGERVRRLAECVRFLRPLQAKREHRSFWDYFTNRKVYIAERDTLRQCKEEMKRLGLSKKEISKVLHGGDFNSVKFLDGSTVYIKQLHPEDEDTIQMEEIVQVQEISKVQKLPIQEENEIVDEEVSVDNSLIDINKTLSVVVEEDEINGDLSEFIGEEEVTKIKTNQLN